MKTMKAVCTATVLALTLSVSTFAGDISSPGAPKTGEIGTPGAVATASSAPATDTTTVVCDLAQGALEDLILALMSIF
jgi:hypothetical protein